MIKCEAELPLLTLIPFKSALLLSTSQLWPAFASTVRGFRKAPVASGPRIQGSTPPLPAIPIIRHTALLPWSQPSAVPSMQARAGRNGGKRNRASYMFLNLPSICIFAKGTKKKINARKRQLRWGCGGTAVDSAPLSKARGWPTTCPSHRCDSLPSGCRPWRSAGPPATEQRRAWVRGSPGDRLEAGTAAGPLQPTFPQIQIRGPGGESCRHRPRPLGQPALGPVHWLWPARPCPQITCHPWRLRLPLGTCYFFFSVFFSVNFCLFIVYNVAQQQLGSSDGSCWERKWPFLLDSVFANRSENS